MDSLVSEVAAFCEWSDVRFLFLSSNVFDPLIYYSHIIPILLALPLAIFVFFSSPKAREVRAFVATVLLFCLWSAIDLVLWAHPDPGYIMFFWSLTILIEPLIYLSALTFVFAVIYRRALPTPLLLSIYALYVPVIVLLPTPLGIASFNLTNCWREVTEGPLVLYGYSVQGFILLAIATSLIYALLTRKSSRLHLLVGIAAIVFLLTFSLGNLVGTLIGDWRIGQFSLFGMPVMIAIIGFLMIEHKLFNTKVLSAQLLVAALFVIALSPVFIQSVDLIRTISIGNAILILALGFLLVRSVKREIMQRVELETLTGELAKANARLLELDKLKSEFVSIASHQLRSPLTSMRGYASMLLDGSYGSIPDKAKEAIIRIAESSGFMARMVENYLNVSRIEAGNMKYELSDFNLKLETEKIVDDKRQEAMKQGLLLTFKADVKSQGVVHADQGKTLEILHNLLNNAIKYTPKGTIEVLIHDDKKAKRIYVDIKDSGIGMTKEDVDKLFGKFSRAKNANSVNTTGTGLGLFVARTMATAMKGDIKAFSDGPGTGSTFRFELPVVL